MENKAQMSMSKLGILLLGLTIIWLMCNRAQLQFQKRFQDDVIARMGGHPFNQTKLNLALDIRQKKTNQFVTQSTAQLEMIFKETYQLRTPREQQLMCILIRDFKNFDNKDDDYLTVKSILKQNYKNFHIIYISQEGDDSIQKIQSYLNVNKILDDQKSFVSAKADTVEALFKGTQKCPKNGIILMMQNGESLISPSVLKVINHFFQPGVDLTWASSIYANDRLGFSFEISEKIKASKQFRKYPLPMNDMIAFRNQLFLKVRGDFIDYRLYYPLYMPESYGFSLLKEARDMRYIPEILSVKISKGKLRVQRSEIQKQMQELIRKDVSVIPLLKSLTVKK